MHDVAKAIVARIGRHIKSVSTAPKVLPLVILDALVVPRVRRASKRIVVLRAAIDVVGRLVIDVDVVELPNGKVVKDLPAPPSIARYCRPTVVSVYDEAWIVRMNPPRVMIDMDDLSRHPRIERLSAVFRYIDTSRYTVESGLIGRIDKDVRIVERTRVHTFL